MAHRPVLQNETYCAHVVNRADASLPYTLTMIGFALGNMVIGRAVGRLGACRSVILAPLLLAGGFGAAAVSGSIWTLSLVQFVIGFGGSVCFGPLIADISHWFYRRRGIAAAIATSGNCLSVAHGATFGCTAQGFGPKRLG